MLEVGGRHQIRNSELLLQVLTWMYLIIKECCLVFGGKMMLHIQWPKLVFALSMLSSNKQVLFAGLNICVYGITGCCPLPYQCELSLFSDTKIRLVPSLNFFETCQDSQFLPNSSFI